MDRPEAPTSKAEVVVVRRKHWAARAVLAIASLALADLAFGLAYPRLRPQGGLFPVDLFGVRGEVHSVATRPYLRPGWDETPSADDPAVIGIFGGSVAYQFAQYLQQAPDLIPEIDALTDHFGRPVIFVNLAVRGGYQPEQFNLLHLSAHRLSAAVFLDGFNEWFNASTSCDELAAFWSRSTAPPSALLRPLASSASSVREILDLADLPLLRHSGLFQVYAFGRVRRMNLLATDTFLGLAGAPRRAGISLPTPTLSVNEHWENCLRHSYDFARARRMPIHFFVQPNQHVPDSKPFAPEESGCCLAVPPNEPPAVQRLYERLPESYADLGARVDRMRAAGIPVRSLRNVFQGTRERVYSDWCCHLNERGNQILAATIFGSMTPTPTPTGGTAP